MIAGAGDGKVRLWSTESGQTIATTGVGHRGPVLAAALSSDGSRFVTLGRDETLRAWDIGRRPQISQTLLHQAAEVPALAVERGRPLRGHR